MSEPQFRPTYLIGLGGTGVAVAQLIKRRYRQHFGRVPEAVRLLAFDTDFQKRPTEGDRLVEEGEAPVAGQVQDVEFVRLSDIDGDAAIYDLDHRPALARWWRAYENAIPVGRIDTGAQQRRPVGRLALFERMKVFLENTDRALKRPFNYVQAQDYPQKLRRTASVYIVASTAGGTGTGMFIDAAVLTRELLQRMGLKARVYGVFVLPGAFSEIVFGSAKWNLLHNSYAALTELDYFMNHPGEGPAADLHYVSHPALGTGTIRIRKPPFNQVFLVSNQNRFGFQLSLQEVFRQASRFVLATASLRVADDANSQLDNIVSRSQPGQPDRDYRGAAAIYGSFGAEEIIYPVNFIPPIIKQLYAKDVASALSDVDLFDVDRKNLETRVSDKLQSGLPQLAAALRYLRDAAALEPRLNDISSLIAQNLGTPDDHRDAVRRFDQSASKVTAAVNSLLDLDLGKDRKRVRDFVSEVARTHAVDKEFRIGGAIRILKQLRNDFESLRTAGLPESIELAWHRKKLEEAKGRILGRTDQERLQAALDEAAGALRANARAQLLRRVKDAIDPLLADALDAAERTIRELEGSKKALRDAAEAVRLRAENEIGKQQWENAARSPSDMGDVIERHKQTLVGQLAERVFFDDDLRGRFGAALDRHSNEAAKRFEELMDLVFDRAESEMERSLTELQDRANREIELRRKAEKTAPLLNLDDNERANVFESGGDGSLTELPPMWIVAGDANGNPDELDASLASLAFGDVRPQFVDSKDPSRDDILNVQVGLPLFLVSEMRAAHESFRSLPPREQRAHFVFPHCADVVGHEVFPVKKAKSSPFFGIALAEGWIRQAGTKITFAGPLASRAPDPIGGGQSWAERLAIAEEQFSRPESIKLVEAWIDERGKQEGGNRQLRESLLASLRKAGAEWKEDDADLQARIRDLTQSAVDWVQGNL